MRGLVFISTGEDVQRFLYSGAFEAIQAKHNLAYVFADPQSRRGIKLDIGSLMLPRVEYIPFHQKRFDKWVELFDVACVAYQDSSPSFMIRFRMKSANFPKKHLPSLNWRHPITLRRFVGAIKTILLNEPRRRKFIRLERLGKSTTYSQYRETVISSLGLHPEMARLVKNYQPDFIILPSCLLDSMTNDVLQIADYYKIPSFLLVSGWDNLSSKGILFHQPTTIAVWGEQTRRHAVDIQRMSPENVFCIGAPHYEAFRMPLARDRNAIRQSIGLPIDEKVVLFGGSFRQFDETSLLRQIEEAIETGTVPRIHILYRPHPWRQEREEDNFFDYAWKHVTMDPVLCKAYRETKISRRYIGSNELLFSMSYLNELYRIVDAVISPMSTLILEAMIFGNPVLAVALDDGKHLWSADKTSQMTHFQELSSVQGVTFCRKSSEFIPLFRQLVLSSDDLVLRESLRRSTRCFVLQADSSYAERLNKLVNERLQWSYEHRTIRSTDTTGQALY